MQTKTHICLITDFCPGSELFLLLEQQPRKVFTEDVVRFFAAEVVIALEYLHCVGKDCHHIQMQNSSLKIRIEHDLVTRDRQFVYICV